MASSTRNHVIKRDIAGTIVSKIATNALVPPRYDHIYYQILQGLDLPNLPAHRQCAAFLFATATCNIINKLDCRQVITEADFQEKLVQAQGIDDLYSQWFRLFDKLNSVSPNRQVKEEERQQEQQTLGEALQSMLAKHVNDDRHDDN